MNKPLTILLSTIIGAGAAVAEVSDAALKKYGSILEKLNYGSHEMTLEGTGRSDVESSVKELLPGMFNTEIDRKKASFLMNSVGGCLTKGIDELIGSQNLDDGDNVTVRANGDRSFDIYSTKKPSEVKKIECGEVIDGLLKKHSELLAKPEEEQSADSNGPVKKQIKKQSYNPQSDATFAYRRPAAEKFANEGTELYKDGKYSEALKSVSLAAELDPKYQSKVTEFSKGYASYLHSESEKHYEKAQRFLGKNKLEKAAESIVKSFNLEAKAAEFDNDYTTKEEYELKGKVAKGIVTRALRTQQYEGVNEAYSLLKTLKNLGLDSKQVNEAYKSADEALK